MGHQVTLVKLKSLVKEGVSSTCRRRTTDCCDAWSTADRMSDTAYGRQGDSFLHLAKNRQSLCRPKYEMFVVLLPWRSVCRASAPAHDAKLFAQNALGGREGGQEESCEESSEEAREEGREEGRQEKSGQETQVSPRFSGLKAAKKLRSTEPPRRERDAQHG